MHISIVMSVTGLWQKSVGVYTAVLNLAYVNVKEL